MESPSVFEMQAELCRAMGNPIRIEIVHLLREAPKNVSELAERTGHPQATVSRHLKTLKNAGVITSKRHGQEIHYQIVNPKIVHVCDLMRQVLVEQAAYQAEIMKGLQDGDLE